MQEYLVNLHIHTRYSDGTGTHAEIARAALAAGLDCVIITDHNVRVRGFDGYRRQDGSKLLILVGEEIHDQARLPQKNHLLAMGLEQEMAMYADRPQQLLDRIRQAGGLSFLAHPYDPALPLFHEEDISWENWEVTNFTGIELWNGMSELKMRIHNTFDALRFSLDPDTMVTGPHPDALSRWDELLQNGTRVVAVGGSDAHAFDIRRGPLRRRVYPYAYHFRAINTHVLTPAPLTWLDLHHDSRLIYQALQQGNCFIGYDLPAPTRGFRFTAQTQDGILNMGDEAEIRSSATLQIRLPVPAECRLIRDGKVVKTWQNQQVCAYITRDPGVYRVEAYIGFLGKRRSWIFSNPIYLRQPVSGKTLRPGDLWS
jgi:hypothetical protein